MGVCMAGLGGYQILTNIRVTTRWSWNFFGHGHHGPGAFIAVFFLGLFFVFFNGRSVLGWILAGGSIAAIIFGVISNLHVYWGSQTLLLTLTEFGLLAGGMGMILKSLTAHDPPKG